MNSVDQCAKCGREAGSLYENPKLRLLARAGVGTRHGVPEKEFLCFDCLDRIAPEYVNKYPGWRERETAKKKRAQVARANFGNGKLLFDEPMAQ